MAYSTDIREKALMYCQNGLTDDEVSAKLGISKHTIVNWKKLLFTTGGLEKKKVKRRAGKPYKYTPEKIKELLNNSKETATPEATNNNDLYPYRSILIQPKTKKKKL